MELLEHLISTGMSCQFHQPKIMCPLQQSRFSISRHIHNVLCITLPSILYCPSKTIFSLILFLVGKSTLKGLKKKPTARRKGENVDDYWGTGIVQIGKPVRLQCACCSHQINPIKIRVTVLNLKRRLLK